MSSSFFDNKKPWSIYKDFILAYYLKPYISKVRFLNKPIAIIDCCAGPGKFSSIPEDGSPLIICKALKEWRDKYETDIVGVFIEKKKSYYNELVKNIKPYKEYANVFKGEFGDYINKIAQLSNKYTIFLYVDPFGVKDLVFEEMAKIFSKIHDNKSVELLMNFNCCGFIRWGLEVFNKKVESDEVETELLEENCSIEDLNKIANGDYWQDIVKADISFEEKEKQLINLYLDQFGCFFKYICNFPVKEKYKNLAKYHLIYGTRHKDGMVLMNDVMYKAREKFLESEFKDRLLFDIRPPEEEKNFLEFEEMILNVVEKNKYIKRADIKLLSIESGAFCRYSDSDYNKTIKKLLQKDKLHKTDERIEEAKFYIK